MCTVYTIRDTTHDLQSGVDLLDPRPLHGPARAREAEPITDARVRDVAVPRDRPELGEVDQAALVQHVVADVEAPDPAEDERHRLLAGLGVDDVYREEELWGAYGFRRQREVMGMGSCMRELGGGGRRTDLAFHAERALLDAGSPHMDLAGER